VFVSAINPNAIPGSSLLADIRLPEGFDENWRHVLKDVGEFRLVEMWRPGGPQHVENRDDVQEAFDQGVFGISDARDGATTPKERARLAMILKTIMQGYFERKSTPEAARQLGYLMMIAGLDDDREAGINTLANRFKTALRSVLLNSDLLPGGKDRKLKPEAAAILEGARIFKETGERPTKSAIKAAMEAKGYIFKGKNAPSRWREVFFRAALHNLPE
jgi:hypothetical protein